MCFAGTHELLNSPPLRAAVVPHKMLRRDGVQTGAGEYPLVSRMPCLPNRSMLGVRRYSDRACATPGCMDSDSWLHPWSSLRIRRKLGLLLFSAAWVARHPSSSKATRAHLMQVTIADVCAWSSRLSGRSSACGRSGQGPDVTDVDRRGVVQVQPHAQLAAGLVLQTAPGYGST